MATSTSVLTPRQKAPVTRSLWTLQSQGGLLLAGAASTFLAIIAPRVLPEKYYADADFIVAIADGSNAVTPDAFYDSAARIYDTLGLAGHPTAVAVLSMAVFVTVLFVALPVRFMASAHWTTLGVAYVSTILAAVYIATYSKESMTLVMVGLAIVASRARRGTAYILLITVAYAAYFRSYWLLVAGAYVLCMFLIRRTSPIRGLTTMIVGSVVAFAAVAFVRDGVTLDTYRETINLGRIGAPDAVTLISPLIHDGGVVAGVVNTLTAFALLLFPVPLVLLGGPLYFGAAAFMATLAVLVSRAYLTVKQRAVESPQLQPIKRSAERQFALILAFSLTQAVYVPDYGSGVKHFSPVLPLIVSLLAAADYLRVSYALRGGERVPDG